MFAIEIKKYFMLIKLLIYVSYGLLFGSKQNLKLVISFIIFWELLPSIIWIWSSNIFSDISPFLFWSKPINDKVNDSKSIDLLLFNFNSIFPLILSLS